MILIVDDNVSYVERIVSILSEDFNAASFHTAGSYEEATTLIDELNPQVAMLDINLPGKSGIDILNYIKKENKDFEFKEDQYKISKSIMELRLKATIANDLFGIEAFYKVYNQKNEILQKAIQLLESNEYDKQKLALN